MKIAIIGAGNVGGTLAKGWANAGHNVIIGSRNIDSEKLKILLSSNKNITANSIIYAAENADVILISVPVQVIKNVALQLGNVQDKVIIDATNSVFSKPEPYKNCFEALKDLTNCKDIVKCFNSTGYENMADPRFGNLKLDMFMAGSGVRAKETALRLSLDIGFENCYDFGGEDKVELLEQFALCWINLAISQKQGREIAFKLIHK